MGWKYTQYERKVREKGKREMKSKEWSKGVRNGVME